MTTKDQSLPTPVVDIYPEQNIKLDWEQQTKIGAGLVNLGNTCFLNSVIQSLTYTAPLANFFLSDGHVATCKQTGFCVLCELQNQIKRNLRNSGTAIRPQEIVENLGLIADTMEWGRQEDAHEFLVYILDSMKRSASCGFDGLDEFSVETTLVGRVFGGFINSQVKCTVCSGVSCRYEAFHEISLEIKGVQTLVKALEKYVTPETLSGDNAYMCETCNTKVTALKGCTIEKPPNVLAVSLQRFDCFTSRKLSHHVHFPEELDVRPYLTCTQGEEMLYQLYAVIVHSGSSSNAGHYYAFVKSPRGQWHCMNDTSVKAVKVSKVLSASAYLLFYQKRKSQKTEQDKTPNAGVSKLEEEVLLKKTLEESEDERQQQDKEQEVEDKEPTREAGARGLKVTPVKEQEVEDREEPTKKARGLKVTPVKEQIEDREEPTTKARARGLKVTPVKKQVEDREEPTTKARARGLKVTPVKKQVEDREEPTTKARVRGLKVTPVKEQEVEDREEPTTK